MQILFISHCLPFPPDKGDRIRAFHLIKELSRENTIFLHAFTRETPLEENIQALERYCASVVVHPQSKFVSSFFALLFVLSPLPLTFGYFFSPGLRRSIRRTLAMHDIDLIFAYSSSTAPYALCIEAKKKIVDLVDVDSAKWAEYAAVSGIIKRRIFSLEHARLRKSEGQIVNRCELTVVCSVAEHEKLAAISAAAAQKVVVMRNGIDFERFPVVRERTTENNLIYTGQMDYLPNIDAMLYFCSEILPLIRGSVPDVKLYIVGRNPDPIITSNCRDAIVTGEVADIRQYLCQAKIFVAPLRLAYGIQNKVLEAMACGIPVVATPQVQRGLKADADKHLLVADTPDEFAEQVIRLLSDTQLSASISDNALRFVHEHHDWGKNVREFETLMRTVVSA